MLLSLRRLKFFSFRLTLQTNFTSFFYSFFSLYSSLLQNPIFYTVSTNSLTRRWATDSELRYVSKRSLELKRKSNGTIFDESEWMTSKQQVRPQNGGEPNTAMLWDTTNLRNEMMLAALWKKKKRNKRKNITTYICRMYMWNLAKIEGSRYLSAPWHGDDTVTTASGVG